MWLRREPFQLEKKACKSPEVGPCLDCRTPGANMACMEWRKVGMVGDEVRETAEPVPIDSYSSGDYLNVGMLWSPGSPLNTGYQPLRPAQSRAQKTMAKDRWGPWGNLKCILDPGLFIQRMGISTWRVRGMTQESGGHGWPMARKRSETRSSSYGPKPVTAAGLLWETQNPSPAGLCLGYKDSSPLGCYCRTTD